MVLTRLKIHVAYTGSYFSGWQVQPGQRTVQGTLEQVLQHICQEFVRIHGAGRTDSGVHALDQVAHADVPETKRDIPWLKALNALVPHDLAVTRVEKVDQEFHARFSALGKEYQYSLWMHPDYVLPQRRAFVWPVGRINWQAMDRAAGYLVGEHDFSAFQNVGTLVKDPVRTLFAITRGQTLSSHEMVWQFCANGFLKQMVRNLMGSLVEVGRGKLAPEDILSLLHTGDRRLLPATAPAKGLCLTRVVYSFESESLTTAS